ncbi:MAG: beta-lactamase family protein [Methylococcales bacterium]|nr:beta-lactamase family protein [Methylococcales bacterium]
MELKRTILLVLLCQIMVVNAGNYDLVKPETVGLSSEGVKRMSHLLAQHVNENKIAGSVVLMARHGKIAYLNASGLADIDVPMKEDTIFRIVSMTKPLTSTAVMLLYEQGKLLLSDPVSKYIPEFKHQKVVEMLSEGSEFPYKLVPVKREVTIHDLLTHQSGLLYLASTGWFPNPKREQVVSFYRDAGITDGFCRPDESIGDMVKRLAKLPLYAHPGETWEYGLSVDVLGYLIEVVSGIKFDDFVQTHIFDPLKMADSHFYIPKNKLSRLSADWNSDWNGKLERVTGPLIDGDLALCPLDAYETSGKYLSGGASVLSTAYDYFRFAQMLLNKGELDGIRLLSRKTIELMTATNHIGKHDATLLHSHGWKFGLGFAIQQDRSHNVDSGDVGVFEWAGYYSTRFSINPKEDMITIFLSQTSPFGAHFGLWDKVMVLSASAIAD